MLSYFERGRLRSGNRRSGYGNFFIQIQRVQNNQSTYYFCNTGQRQNQIFFFFINYFSGKIIYEKEKNLVLPLASIAKIVSTLVILDALDLNEEVAVSRTAVSTPEPSSLKVGEHFLAR